jgi:hypothetical protein
MRQNFTSGQEIISADLVSISSRLERGLLDRIIYEMIQRKSDAFFGDGFKVLRQTATALTVKAGLGFQYVDTGTLYPVRKPLVLDTDLTVNINTPDASNPRIDIISVKQNRYNAETENRKFKDEFTDVIANADTVIATDWKADVLYTPGSPAGSPAVPATPAGYIKIAEVAVSASTGISASGTPVTDKRALLPFCGATSVSGSKEWDAVVGDTSLVGVTHASLKLALDNASDGWKILVLRDETVNATAIVAKNNVEIVFKRGVTMTRGSAVSALQVDGNDCKIVNARFKDYTTGGDKALKVSAGALRTYLEAPRFYNCTATKLDDLGTDTFTNVLYTE